MKKYAILIVLVTACGYPPLDHSAIDAKPGGGPDGHSSDGPHSIDGMLPDAGNGCPAPASYAGGATTNNEADHYAETNNSPEEYFLAGDINNASDWVFVDLYDQNGVFTNGLHTGTFTITGAELNYDSCGACVLVAAGCNNCNLFDGSGSADYYMATGGAIKITTLSPTLAGTLTNVTLVHVTVDNTGSNPTYHTTPLADGCTTAIPTRTFSQHVTEM